MKFESRKVALCLAAVACSLPGLAFADNTPHNVILFVPDGLRAAIVSKETAPAMAALRDEGVNFRNSHSLFPTFTTANASAFATGHLLGDTGDFSNVVNVGFPVKAAGDSLAPFLESNAVLQEIDGDERYAGNYLNEESVLAAAQKLGYSTAAIGKVGPAAIQNLGAMKDGGTLILDDSTGPKGVLTLPQEWQDAIAAAKLKAETPGRGDNGSSGNSKTPGTWIPNYAQQQYFLEVAIKVVLPRFKAAQK
ncbi:MAG: nucleotide pyrophosphatase, partial [Nevskia sp.]|nr:nucleotide pyrophosphatase [Nevskia sp.]